MSKRRVRIVSAAAFYVSRKENAKLAFNDKEFYWTGVRGSEHYPEFYLREQRVARRSKARGEVGSPQLEPPGCGAR